MSMIENCIAGTCGTDVSEPHVALYHISIVRVVVRRHVTINSFGEPPLGRTNQRRHSADGRCTGILLLTPSMLALGCLRRTQGNGTVIKSPTGIAESPRTP